MEIDLSEIIAGWIMAFLLLVLLAKFTGSGLFLVMLLFLVLLPVFSVLTKTFENFVSYLKKI